MKMLLIAALLLVPAPSFAQATTGQKVSDVARWATLVVSELPEVNDCVHSAHKVRCWSTLAARQGAVQGGSLAIAHWYPQSRPCEPSACFWDVSGNGMPSRHMATVASTFGPPSDGVGPRLVIAASATALTALFTGQAKAHTAGQMVAGAALGYAASYIR